MSRGDVALFARTVASSSHTNTSAVFVYETAPNGSVTARMAVAAAGQVNMTAPFDPCAAFAICPHVYRPATTADSGYERATNHGEAAFSFGSVYAPPAVLSEVAEWAARAQQGKDRVGREAVLRHLIRVMFAWILKEEIAFRRRSSNRPLSTATLSNSNVYHRDVLQFLFHRRLNVRYDERDPHPIAEINEALERAPF